MQNLFDEVRSLDQRCYDKFGLSEDILMEHAANGIAEFIRERFAKNSKIVIACGSGNNGADGLALARLLHYDYDVKVFYVKRPKSPMAILQAQRTKAIGVTSTMDLDQCDAIVDAVYGTGFKGKITHNAKSVIQAINHLDTFKIACDIPSGIQEDGQCDENTFEADVTLTMGALKKSMFSDEAKEFIGEIKVINLGIARSIYEKESKWKLLEFDDMQLPYRDQKNTHKGTYGHLCIPSGEKAGASIMSGLAALRFGTGLVSLISCKEPSNLPPSIMYSCEIPYKAKALALGMGLGLDYDTKILKKHLSNTLPLIADADIFYLRIVLDILKRDNVVLTPHPKEFISLLKLTTLADIDIDELQRNRFKYVTKFCAKYPNITLLLKGANVIIGQNDEFYINNQGTPALAKGGSGDVLSGLIGALLAQGYSALIAAINASLAHTKLVQNYEGPDFSLTPNDLIEGIGKL